MLGLFMDTNNIFMHHKSTFYCISISFPSLFTLTYMLIKFESKKKKTPNNCVNPCVKIWATVDCREAEGEDAFLRLRALYATDERMGANPDSQQKEQERSKTSFSV